MRCFILPHVVMVHTCCIQPDLMLVPRPRVDVGAERTMTRFLFFGYTLAYSPQFQRSDCIETFNSTLCMYTARRKIRRFKTLLLLRRSFCVFNSRLVRGKIRGWRDPLGI